MLGVAVVAGLAAYHFHHDPGPPSALTAAGSALRVPRSDFLPGAPTPNRSLPIGADHEPRGKRIQQLSLAAARGDAKSAFAAYQAAAYCASTQDLRSYFDTLPRDEENRAIGAQMKAILKEQEPRCVDVTQLQLTDRFRIVKIAADAHIPGAAVAFVGEGPWGDSSALYQRPDDPAVKKWRTQAVRYLNEAASAGDLMAMDVLANSYQYGSETPVDLGKSLAYQVAIVEVLTARGSTQDIVVHPFVIRALEAQLSADARRAAREQGHDLAQQMLALPAH